jgi:thioredoxin 1
MKTRMNIIKLLLIVVICFSLPIRSNAQTVKNDQIHFMEDAWNAALKKAAAENKYIFVDAYATWCGPCKMLKATTFKDAKVAAFYNKNFINVSMDMEKGIGPKLAAEWQMQAYPTLIIFNPKGQAVLGTVGYIKANELLKFGQQALAKKM